MEAFEQFVAVALGSEGFVVSSAVKFPIRRQSKKKAHIERQKHGYEVDLVGARGDRLVLASVKSYFGSHGVQAREVMGLGGNVGLYRMLNDGELRELIIAQAAKRYGYKKDQVYMRLYVGKFAGTRGCNEGLVRSWAATQHVGGGPIEIIDVKRVIEQVSRVAASKTYIDNPVIVSMKVLAAAGLFKLPPAAVSSEQQSLDDGELQDDDSELTV